jgi:hypothetical protein
MVEIGEVVCKLLELLTILKKGPVKEVFSKRKGHCPGIKDEAKMT